MPCTPMAERASRTSSSLKGLMMAVISFTISLLWDEPGAAAAAPTCRLAGATSEGLGQRGDEACLVGRLAVGEGAQADGAVVVDGGGGLVGILLVGTHDGARQ